VKTILLLLSVLCLLCHPTKTLASPLPPSCPFMHEDPFGSEMTQILIQIEGFLKKKLDTYERCNGPLHQVTKNFQNINSLIDYNKNPALLYQVNVEVLSQQLLELEMDLKSQNPLNPNYFLIASAIQSIKNQIFSNKAQGIYSQKLFSQNRENMILSQTSTALQNTIQTLTSLDSDCIDQIGGWQTVLPPLLSSLGNLSAMGGLHYGAAAGAVLHTASSLLVLLKDIKAKKALRHFIRHKNQKALACTYYALQNTACQYQKALRLAQNPKNFEQESKEAIPNHYKRFQVLKRKSRDLTPIFQHLIQISMPPRVDQELLIRYGQAKHIQAHTLLGPHRLGPPPHKDDLSEGAQQKRLEWILRAKDHGVPTQEDDKPLPQQIEEALIYIQKAQEHENRLDKIFSLRRSFLDFKHELDLKDTFSQDLTEYLAFFEKSIAETPQLREKRGLFVPIQKLFSALIQFQSIQLGESYEDYLKAVGEKGEELLALMSQETYSGAICPAPMGHTPPQDLLEQIFQAIEMTYPEEYKEFKKKQDLHRSLVQSYPNLRGCAQTFRLEDTQTAFDILERSYRKEMIILLEKSLFQKSRFYPELEGVTAGHLCTLFNQALEKPAPFYHERRMRKIHKTCHSRYKTLELLPVLEPKEMEIQWDDPCFYSTYQRFFQTQQSLYQVQMSENQFPE
jgi:hypothetical protein